jgi:flagellar capping protein FliD
MLSYDLNVYPESIEQLPIKNINFDDAKEKKIYKDIVDSVNKILKLNAEQNQNKDNLNDNYYEVETEIEKTNTKIDNLVYELYGLTEEEIKIIEAQ